MLDTDTILLRRHEVSRLLTAEECIDAVENAFKLHAEGKIQPPGILGVHVQSGGFHIKAGVLELDRSYFVAKVNANFPGNLKQYGLPTIQGVIVVCDVRDGRLLALMDSIEITILRTGAATAIAAKYLARSNAKTATIFGCGNQGIVTLKMLMKVRQLERVYVYDIDAKRASAMARDLTKDLNIAVVAVNDWQRTARESDICITCTPSTKPFLGPEHIAPGTFIGAVGADSEGKQELDPSLLISNKVIADLVGQCATIGELHHALMGGLMTREDVHAELGEVIAGRKSGRTADEEIIIFDSTGTALQDVAAAAIVYEKALRTGTGARMVFNS